MVTSHSRNPYLFGITFIRPYNESTWPDSAEVSRCRCWKAGRRLVESLVSRASDQSKDYWKAVATLLLA